MDLKNKREEMEIIHALMALNSGVRLSPGEIEWLWISAKFSNKSYVEFTLEVSEKFNAEKAKN